MNEEVFPKSGQPRPRLPRTPKPGIHEIEAGLVSVPAKYDALLGEALLLEKRRRRALAISDAMSVLIG